MGIEIEHKFTVHKDLLPELGTGIKIIQGDLPTESLTKTRIRVTSHYNYKKAYLTIKSESVDGICQEFEYEIPVLDGLGLLQLCPTRISKTRHKIDYKQHTWELDIFDGDNEGLIMAELEFDEIGEMYHIPDWANKEVTGDERYFNSNLLENPYNTWV